MVPRWLTGPLKPNVFLAVVAYFLVSCLVAAQINGGSARISNPTAASVLAVMAGVIAIVYFAPVLSPPARQGLLRADAAFGVGDKANLVFSGFIALAFAVGLTVVAIQGVSQP